MIYNDSQICLLQSSGHSLLIFSCFSEHVVNSLTQLCVGDLVVHACCSPKSRQNH